MTEVDVSVKLASGSVPFQIAKLKVEPFAAAESEPFSFVPTLARCIYVLHIHVNDHRPVPSFCAKLIEAVFCSPLPTSLGNPASVR